MAANTFYVQNLNEYLEQLLANYDTEPLRDVVQNIMDEPNPEQAKERLLRPLRPSKYKPKPMAPSRKKRERK